MNFVRHFLQQHKIFATIPPTSNLLRPLPPHKNRKKAQTYIVSRRFIILIRRRPASFTDFLITFFYSFKNNKKLVGRFLIIFSCTFFSFLLSFQMNSKKLKFLLIIISHFTLMFTWEPFFSFKLFFFVVD